MKPAEVERLLLSSLKTPAHLYTLKQKHNLEEGVFAFYQEEARYIFKYLIDYGTPPPKELIEAQMNDLLTGMAFKDDITAINPEDSEKMQMAKMYLSDLDKRIG